MSPRQRISPQPSMEDITNRGAQQRALLSDESSAGSDESNAESRHVKYPSSTAPQKQQTLEDVAREQHDLFNLVALLFVVAATFANWDIRELLKGKGPKEAWTDHYFYVTWATSVLYFLTDLIWVSRVPICVKSPGVIIKHHIVAILYLSAPVVMPDFRWLMGACLSVEINTWFLILRRYKRKERNPVLQEIVSWCFYVSWIVIRCFVYPAIMVVFMQMAYAQVVKTDSIWHWQFLFLPIHFSLCLLNFKWTYDLFLPIVKRCFSPDVDAASTVSSGL